jgi:hypothetical protein
MIMRPLILFSLFLLPLSACMTQRDQTVWQEFKAEISSDEKAETKKVDAEAASEAVTPPAAVDKIQE